MKQRKPLCRFAIDSFFHSVRPPFFRFSLIITQSGLPEKIFEVNFSETIAFFRGMCYNDSSLNEKE